LATLLLEPSSSIFNITNYVTCLTHQTNNLYVDRLQDPLAVVITVGCNNKWQHKHIPGYVIAGHRSPYAFVAWACVARYN